MGKHSARTGGSSDKKRSAGRARGAQPVIGGGPSSSSAKLNGRSRLDVPKDGTARPDTLESAPPRLRAERERRSRRWKRAGIVGLIAVAAIVALSALGAWLWARGLENEMVDTEESVIATLEKSKPQEPFTVLILGADKRKSESYRTDTMILAKIDPRSRKVWMLSIPRDTRVEMPGRGAIKINAANAYGGTAGAIDAVKGLTGVPINHYMEVDFLGFAKAVDALGGVWIDVPVEIDDKQAASASNGEASHIDKGYQLLDGAHALTFVRARHQFADQDFSRMKNQQLFFKALAEQVSKGQNITKLPGLVSGIAPYVKSDMSLLQMIRTAQAIKGVKDSDMQTATLEGDWRSPFIYVDEKNMHKLVDRMNAGVAFDATSTAGAGTDGDAQASAKKPSEIGITVKNGGRVTGSAKQAASILRARGYEILDKNVGNADQMVYETTYVVYRDDAAAAELVATALPPGAKIVQSAGRYLFDTDILVVTGKDWDIAKVPVTPVTN